MLKIGTLVSYEGGEGTIGRTSIRAGVKLYRVNDKWFERAAIGRV